jgi:hypothetical protein
MYEPSLLVNSNVSMSSNFIISCLSLPIHNNMQCHVSTFDAKFRTAFSDPANKAIMNKLIKEVQAQNPTFESGDSHGKLYRVLFGLLIILS